LGGSKPQKSNDVLFAKAQPRALTRTAQKRKDRTCKKSDEGGSVIIDKKREGRTISKHGATTEPAGNSRSTVVTIGKTNPGYSDHERKCRHRTQIFRDFRRAKPSRSGRHRGGAKRSGDSGKKKDTALKKKKEGAGITKNKSRARAKNVN